MDTSEDCTLEVTSAVPSNPVPTSPISTGPQDAIPASPVDGTTRQPKPFHCQLCDQTMSDSIRLWKHELLIHSGLKAYLCHVCNKEFFVAEKLNEQNEKASYCCDYCRISFPSGIDLKEHVKTCLEAPKGSVEVDIKKEPGTVDMKEELFKSLQTVCPDCGDGFSDRSTLHIHRGVCYPCGICGKSFSGVDKLLTHKEDAHHDTAASDSELHCQDCQGHESRDNGDNSYNGVSHSPLPTGLDIQGLDDQFQETWKDVMMQFLGEPENQTNLSSGAKEEERKEDEELTKASEESYTSRAGPFVSGVVDPRPLSTSLTIDGRNSSSLPSRPQSASKPVSGSTTSKPRDFGVDSKLKSLLEAQKANGSFDVSSSTPYNSNHSSSAELTSKSGPFTNGTFVSGNFSSGGDSFTSLKFQNEIPIDDVAPVPMKEEPGSSQAGLYPQAAFTQQQAEAQSNQLKSRAVETDNEVKTFQCDICSESFTHRTNLRRHISHMHSGRNLFPCEFCDKKYARSDALKVHVKMCHPELYDERNYTVCSTCGKDFRTHKSLLAHELTHKGIKPFQCDICLEYFTDRSNLKRHKQMHTNPRRHQCPFCDKNYCRIDVLKAHKKNVHPSEFKLENKK